MNLARPVFPALAASLLLAACGARDADTPAAPVAEAPPPATAASGTAQAPDGAPIAWWQRGAGETTLLFIHGWSCDREFWREQIDAFDDYRVVTLDLPGHGDSGGTRDPWRVADYGADVAAVADALELDRIVLVGHSMGGHVALRAAAELEGRVLGIVAADSLHDAELNYTPEQAAPALTAFAEDYPGAMTAMFTGMAGNNIDPELAGWIAAKGVTSRPEVGMGLFSSYTEIDTAAWFRNAGVPVRAINAEPGGMTPETHIERNRQYADFDAIIIDGVGHFLQLEAPASFNAALREVLVELESG